MTEKCQYTKDDLQTFKLVRVSRENGVTSHTHVVEFARALTNAECDLFQSILIDFYYTVRFSHQFGGDFTAEPTIEFLSPQTAQYTLYQKSMSGPWKDLLFVILSNFSLEVVPIIKHDISLAFDPNRVKVAAD